MIEMRRVILGIKYLSVKQTWFRNSAFILRTLFKGRTELQTWHNISKWSVVVTHIIKKNNWDKHMKQCAKEINCKKCWKDTDRFISLHLQIANREWTWSGFIFFVPSVFNRSYYRVANITEKPAQYVSK